MGVLEAETVLAPLVKLTFLNEAQSKVLTLVEATNKIKREDFLTILEKEPEQESKLGCSLSLFKSKIPATQSNIFRQKAIEFYTSRNLRLMSFIKIQALQPIDRSRKVFV
jgi:hypothetical protein